MAGGRGARRSHCQNVRRGRRGGGGGPAVMPAPRTEPEISTRSRMGSPGPGGSGSVTLPPCCDMSPASTTMPGLVIRLSPPPLTSAIMRSSGCVINAPIRTTPGDLADAVGLRACARFSQRTALAASWPTSGRWGPAISCHSGQVRRQPSRRRLDCRAAGTRVAIAADLVSLAADRRDRLDQREESQVHPRRGRGRDAGGLVMSFGAIRPFVL